MGLEASATNTHLIRKYHARSRFVHMKCNAMVPSEWGGGGAQEVAPSFLKAIPNSRDKCVITTKESVVQVQTEKGKDADTPAAAAPASSSSSGKKPRTSVVVPVHVKEEECALFLRRSGTRCDGGKITRFADPLLTGIAYLPPLSEISPEERGDVWWCQNDFIQFREDAKIWAGFVRRHLTLDHHPNNNANTNNKTSGPCAYTQACCYASTAAEQDEDGHTGEHALVQPKPQVVQRLLEWSNQYSDVRGVEDWTSPWYFEARRNRIAQVRKMVLQNNNNNLDSAKSSLGVPSLAERTAACSQTSRIMARVWGEVDALAVLQEEDMNSKKNSPTVEVATVDAFACTSQTTTTIPLKTHYPASEAELAFSLL